VIKGLQSATEDKVLVVVVEGLRQPWKLRRIASVSTLPAVCALACQTERLTRALIFTVLSGHS
jgi:nitrate reductase NapAB chaperone NapD